MVGGVNMTAKTDAERRRDADARKRKAGLIPLHVWIPADQANAVKMFVKDICDKKTKII